MMWTKIPRGTRVLETQVPVGTRTWRRTDPRRKRKNRRRKHGEEEKKKKTRRWRSDRPPAPDRPLRSLCSSSFFSNQILFFVATFFRFCFSSSRCVLQVLFFFKSDKNRVCKSRFWFLELESYRLEIYMAKLAHGSSRTRVWKRWFSSSISSFKNSRLYFPLSFHTLVNLLYTTPSHY